MSYSGTGMPPNSGYGNPWMAQTNPKWPGAAEGSAANADGGNPQWKGAGPQPNPAVNPPTRPQPQQPSPSSQQDASSTRRLILIGLLSNSNQGPFKIPADADLSGETEVAECLTLQQYMSGEREREG
eukprot:GHVU01229270.1.p1 GENE.GHVU01229270.1~~GHVU01229270.1.p1  ORF type:complete len:127 (-),score=8.28 GHVU01229270.1:840-1220(-)